MLASLLPSHEDLGLLVHTAGLSFGVAAGAALTVYAAQHLSLPSLVEVLVWLGCSGGWFSRSRHRRAQTSRRRCLHIPVLSRWRTPLQFAFHGAEFGLLFLPFLLDLLHGECCHLQNASVTFKHHPRIHLALERVPVHASNRMTLSSDVVLGFETFITAKSMIVNTPLV